MKKGNRILCLCAALFALITIGGLIHTSPALAWDTWPAGTHNDPNHVWTVVFDKAMNAATINSQNIYVSNDIQGSSRVTGVSVRASDSKHALVAPPAGGWKSGASYYLIITQKVLTSANRPLKDEVRMPFHIKAITRAVPTVDVINNGSQMIVKVNGTQLSLKQPPYTVSGHPMVPIKEIAQALGAAVDWDAKNKKMTIMGDKVAELTIGSKTARVNGAAVTLETPAAVTAGTIMAPLSFLQPALGAKVNYTYLVKPGQNQANGQPEYGNTGGNISNGGCACQKGDWIYYSNNRLYGELYRVKTDGSGCQKLNDDSAEYINVAGDWIYYSNGDDQGKLYRIKTDGSERQKLNDDNTEYINVAGDWIYYSGGSNLRLYRIKTDGSGCQKLNDNGSSEYINVAGDWVYYSNPYSGIYRIKTDGSVNQMLSKDAFCECINVVGNWVYYCSSGGEGHGEKLYRIKTDGSGRQKLNDGDVTPCINVSDGWVYYCNKSDYGKLYRIKADGSGRQKLIDGSIGNINIVGNWIYSRDSIKLYRVKTDGSGREEIQ